VIDPAVVLSAELQVRLGLACPLDTRPEVVRVGLPQIRQIRVDGVGVDIDRANAGGWVSVDGRDSVRWAGESSDGSYCVCIIQDVHP
jgi:hypothetical protein